MLINYIKYHRMSICYYLVCIFVFSIVFFLSDLPIDTVLYGALLCTFVGVIFFGIDYLHYWKKNRQLQIQQTSITINMDLLPTPKDSIEEEYQKLLQVLFDEKNRIQLKSDQSQSEMHNYYTMWVHQIKTPIAAMRLLLQSGEYNSSALEGELFKIEQYVEMVLSYLRLGSETTDYVIKWYSLDDIIKQALRKYAKLFILKKIKLDYEETDRKILTDEKWLLFVFEQLLSNALKYTKEGTITITVTDNQVCIKDTGIGIAGEDIPRVFEQGFTGYNGRSDKKSTGIGLYLCKQIVQRLGLSISIESTVGKGTNVILHISEGKCDTNVRL